MKRNRTISDALYLSLFPVKRKKSEERKLRIVEAVVECIATRGLEHTTFEVIGKMVKMERTHVSYYFSSRDELIKGAVRYVVAVGQEITIGHVKKAENWKDRFTAVIEAPFEWLKLYPNHAPVMGIFSYLATYNEEFRKLQNAVRTGGEERLLASLQPLVENGKLSKVHATELCRAIHGMLTGNITFYFSSDYPLTFEALKAKTVKAGFRLLDTYLKN